MRPTSIPSTETISVVYDERAVKAVKAASPFPRVPPELMARAKPGSAGVTIRAGVTYKLVTSP